MSYLGPEFNTHKKSKYKYRYKYSWEKWNINVIRFFSSYNFYLSEMCLADIWKQWVASSGNGSKKKCSYLKIYICFKINCIKRSTETHELYCFLLTGIFQWKTLYWKIPDKSCPLLEAVTFGIKALLRTWSHLL